MPKVTSEEVFGQYTSELLDRLEAEYQAGLVEDGNDWKAGCYMRDYWKHLNDSPDID